MSHVHPRARDPSPGPRNRWIRFVEASSLLGAAVLLLVPLGGWAEERRCKELGAECYCSEPLDNTDTYPGVHNPSDSKTKECGIYDANTPGKGTSELAVPFPPGATARNVLFVAKDTGLNKLLTWPPPPPIDMTNKTFCVRSYRNYGKDHALPGNLKIARIGGAEGSVSWQSSWTTEPSVNWIGPLGAGGYVDCHLGSTGAPDKRIHFADCQSHWCRFEICADHNGATGEFTVRGQWSQVGGPKRMGTALGGDGQYGPDCSPERSPTASLVGGLVVAEFATVCCPENPGGSVYVSHVMASHGSYDPDFWIGPAVEIEGTSATPASE